MSKFSYKIAIFAVFALFLAGCYKPVGVKKFIDDPEVQEMIKETRKLTIILDLENTDFSFEWSDNGVNDWEAIDNDNPPSIDFGNTIYLRIIGIDEAVYDTGSVEWFYNEITPLSSAEKGAEGNILELDTNVSPFNGIKSYTISVVWAVNGIPYSAYFKIEVSNS